MQNAVVAHSEKDVNSIKIWISAILWILFYRKISLMISEIGIGRTRRTNDHIKLKTFRMRLCQSGSCSSSTLSHLIKPQKNELFTMEVFLFWCLQIDNNSLNHN